MIIATVTRGFRVRCLQPENFMVEDQWSRASVLKKKIFVMAGHEGGVMAFGRDLRSAFAQLTKRKSGESQ